MKKYKKILIALLAMLLCAATMTSCLGDATGKLGAFGAFESGDATTDSEGDTNTPSGNDSGEMLEIIKFAGIGLTTDYQIVFSASAKDYEKAFAQTLQTAIANVTGVTIPLMSDVRYYDDPATMKEKEILIGTTNREEQYVIPSELDIYNLGYAMFATEQKLVILPATQTGCYFALRDFIYTQFGQDLDELDKDVANLTKSPKTLKLASDYATYKTINSLHLPYIDVAVAKYTIVYSNNYENENTVYMLKRMAYGIQDGVKAATGYAPDLGIETVNTSGAVIRVHLVDKEEVAGTDNEWIEPGKWTLEYSNKEFTITASSYLGFFDAAGYFSRTLNAWGFYDYGENDVSAEGYFTDNLTRANESAKYCYDRDEGDVRVMFLNVLFGASAGDNGEYSVPPDERNQVQQIMFAEYMPDVLGCQEFNASKRGYAQANELNGKGGLSGLLAELGYAEVVDPRVKNAYLTTEPILGSEEYGYLTNPNVAKGDPIMGYGVGGAYECNYNGVQYTYYNNTPIFYNTATTKLIASDYYWYRYQWDFIHKDETGALIHENSASDAGSKSATWAVLEDIASGQRYIVVSTHMCTRSNFIRGFQAQEIVDLINTLVETYDCPVFFGGDMNGNGTSTNTDPDTGEVVKGSANYNLFMENFISLQDTVFEDGSHLATEFTSMVGSSHGYPNYDKEKRIMTPGANNKVWYAEGNSAGGSIDQIFVTNLNDDVEIKVFGFIFDDCSLSSSDHLPYFVDFNLGGETNAGADWGPTVTS